METSAIKVLLIDDEPDLLDVSKQFLELHRSISVDTMTSAADALKQLELRDYDVIVSDYQMPGKDGIQLLKEIRSAGNNIPLILFTGKGREEVAIEALNSGADFYLQKGGQSASQFDELANMIKKACSIRRGERRLRVSEERLRTYLDNAPEGIFVVDELGNYQDVNKTACSMLKYSREELLKLNIADITDESVILDAMDGFQRLKEKGSMTQETILVRKDGIGIPIFLNTVALPNQRYMAFCADISERKQAEYRLITSEQRYRRLFETAQDGILILDFKSEKIVDANKFILDMIGYSLDGAVDRNLWELGFIEDRPMAEKAFSVLRRNGYVRDENISLKIKNGEIVPVEFTSNVYQDNETKIIQCNIRDISERQLKDKKIEELARIVDSANDAIIGKDLNGIITCLNRGAERIYGYTKDEIIGQSISLLAAPDSEDEIEEILAMVSRGEFISRYETTRLTKDGRKINVSLMISPVLDDQGRIVGASTIASDITDRKRAEESLQYCEERYHLLVERAAESIAVAQDGMLRMVNPMTMTIIGFSRQELLSKPFESFIHPDDRTMIAERFQKRLSGEALPARYAFRVLTKDGNTKWVEINAAAIDWEGRPATLNFITDITERKKTEDVLRESEESYHRILDQAADGIIVHDATGKIIDVNLKTCRSLGYSQDELLSMSIKDIDSEATQEKNVKLWNAVLAGETFTIESHQIRKDGSAIPVEVTLGSVNLPSGKAVLGIVRDITERKRNEQRLATAQQKLNEVYHLAHIGKYDWIIDGDIVTWSEGLFEISGRDPSLPPPSHEEQIRLYSPESWERLSTSVTKAIATGEPFDLELDMIRPDGSVRNVSAICSVERDKEGKVIEFHGLVQDITDQKRAERGFQEANRKLNLLSSITRHDIKNQLMALDGNLTLLSKKKLDPASEELLRKSTSALGRISTMIQFTKEYEDVGVKAPIWQNVRSLVEKEAKVVTLNQINLVNDIPFDIEVFADPLIAKVFHNLINNAMRHGGKVTTIRFYLEERDCACAAICEDDGVGITSEMKRELFAHGSGKDHGFGLFLSREILGITGMTIKENGEQRKGARFEISIPAGVWCSG